MTLQEYLKLPYKISIQEINDESGHYFLATVDELPGCMSDGKTVEEAYKNIREALELHIESMIEDNMDIPIPLSNKKENYSGKFVLRIPKTLHRILAIKAQNEGVSLNQYALFKLSN